MEASQIAHLSDLELVSLCQRRPEGDERAFAELFRRHQNAVWRTCFRYAGNTQDAEDLTQEVFFRVYRGLPRFEARSAFKTWLYRITLNTCQNELRSRRRELAVNAVSVEEVSESLSAEAEPGHLGDLLLSQIRMAELLAEVRPDDREALYLRDVEGLSFAEIADTLLNLLTIFAARLALSFALGGRELAHNILAGFYAKERYRLGDRLVVEGQEGTLAAIGTLNAEIALGEERLILPNAQLLETVIRVRPSSQAEEG